MKILQGIVKDNNKGNGNYDGRIDVMIKEEDAGNAEVTVCKLMGSTAFGLNSNVGLSSMIKNGTPVYVIEDDSGEHYIIGTVYGQITNGQYTSGDGAVTNNVSNGGKEGTNHLHPELTSAETYDKVQILRTECGHTIRLCDVAGREEVDIIHNSGSSIKFMSDGTIKIFAKKNLEIDVQNDMITYVLGNQYTEIRKDRTSVIKKNEDCTVEQNRDRHVKNTETVEIGNNYERLVSNKIYTESGSTTTMKESGLEVKTELSRFSGGIETGNNIVSNADVKSKGGGVTMNGHTHTGAHGETTAGHG